MTEQTGDVLADIDAALEGWHGDDSLVSDDAMRWSPEAPDPAGVSPLEMYRRALDAQLVQPVQPGTTFAAPIGHRGRRVEWTVLDEAVRVHTSENRPSPIDVIVADALARSVADTAGRLFGVPPDLVG